MRRSHVGEGVPAYQEREGGALGASQHSVYTENRMTRACYEVCTKIGAYVGGRSCPVWKDGKQGESRLSERCFG